jgi:branched-chain amino acid transport system substrate-binding protein
MCSCTQSTNTTTGTNKPIKIGISLSFSGDYSDDSKLFEKGYQLWADTVNKQGGLLGRPVQLDVVSDASSPTQVVTNYQKLITVDHVDLTFGPFSSLLTKPASVITNRYGYALPEGAGGAPSVFTRGLHNIFCVSLPADQYLQSFGYYLLSLPARMRPKTVVYAAADDPFAQPQVAIAQSILESKGLRTVGSAPGTQIIWPAETTDYNPIAQKIIDSGADVVVLGTTGVQDSVALTKAFQHQHFKAKALIEASGPDQTQQFAQAISAPEGIFVPGSWWPQMNAPGNAQMITDYIARYGGKQDSVSSDIAEAFSVGQVMQQAIEKIHSLDNQQIINELHSDTFNTVQGVVKFDATGKDPNALATLFQWQNGKLIPVYPDQFAQANPEFPKASW